MQNRFFNRGALGGTFCALLAGLVFVISSCGGDSGTKPEDPSSSSGGGYVPPDIKSDPSIEVTTFTFEWKGSNQDYVSINVATKLSLGDNPDSTIKGFDSVLVKLEGKVLNDDKCKEKFTCTFRKDGTDALDVANVGTCGGKINLVVEAYAYGDKVAKTVQPKSLDKANGVGICKSSSSEAPSSSAAAPKNFVPITFTGDANCTGTTCLITATRGINFATKSGTATGPGSDLYMNWTARKLEVGGSIAVIIDTFDSATDPGSSCGPRGLVWADRVSEGTKSFFPCPSNSGVTSGDAAESRFYVLKTTAAKDAADWNTGWYLIQADNFEENLSRAGTLIKAWTVSN